MERAAAGLPMRPVRSTCSMVDEQTVAIVQHDPVELLALGLVHRARLQGLQVEADGSDGSLQFMRDGIDEGVVLFVAADLTHQKDGVEHDAADDHSQQDPARKSRMPVRQLSSTSRCREDRMTGSARRRGR